MQSLFKNNYNQCWISLSILKKNQKSLSSQVMLKIHWGFWVFKTHYFKLIQIIRITIIFLNKTLKRKICIYICNSIKIPFQEFHRNNKIFQRFYPQIMWKQFSILQFLNLLLIKKNLIILKLMKTVRSKFNQINHWN